MSCTVLIGTRDNHRACGLGAAETCRTHRLSRYALPRAVDALPSKTELDGHVSRSPGGHPGRPVANRVGANQVGPNRASEA